jgi:hypothetical protein
LLRPSLIKALIKAVINSVDEQAGIGAIAHDYQIANLRMLDLCSL